MIRRFEDRDFEQLKLIHEKFYKDEFSFDDFCHSFIDFFVVTENEKIICAGGIRAIAESVIITNKDISPKIRQQALLQTLHTQLVSCSKVGFHQLHAFIQDKKWEQRLIKTGFKPCKGNAIFIEVD
jgi:hypothetical protein